MEMISKRVKPGGESKVSGTRGNLKAVRARAAWVKNPVFLEKFWVEFFRRGKVSLRTHLSLLTHHADLADDTQPEFFIVVLTLRDYLQS